MPADSIRPDAIGGEARFRADLAAYLDSLPAHELGSCSASCRAAASSQYSSACSWSR
jgi:hypothetical protein